MENDLYNHHKQNLGERNGSPRPGRGAMSEEAEQE